MITEVTIFFAQGIYEELQWVLLLGFHSENWMGVLGCSPQYRVPLEIYVKILDKEQRKAYNVAFFCLYDWRLLQYGFCFVLFHSIWCCFTEFRA